MSTKRHLILARNTRINETGLQTGAGRRMFQPGKSGMYIKDAAEAREIEQHYGKHGTNDVHVFEDDKVARFVRNDSSEIHNYTFRGVDTSHLRKPKAGDKKIVGDMVYRYIEYGGKLRLIPAKYTKQKRRRRASVRRED